MDKVLTYGYNTILLGVILLFLLIYLFGCFQANGVLFYPMSLCYIISIIYATLGMDFFLWSGPFVKSDIGWQLP